VTGPATVELVLLGGHRHGHTQQVAADATSWVDLITATTYYRRPFAWGGNDPTSLTQPQPWVAYQAEALVHEAIAGNRMAMDSWWLGLAMLNLMRQYGTEIPMGQVTMGPQPNGGKPR
jgi:hypothetical protein